MSLLKGKPIFDKVIGFWRLKVYYSPRNPRNCYLTLDIPKTGEYHRLQANDKLYGLILNCVLKGDEKALKSAIDIYLSINALLFATQKNIEAFVTTANSIAEGLFVRAEQNVAKSMPEQEAADAAFMQDVVEATEQTKKERKIARKKMKEIAKEIADDASKTVQ